MLLNNQKGMTIRELVVVVGLILLMILFSIPAFFSLRNLSREKEMLSLVKLLQSRIDSGQFNYASGLAPFPDRLDNNGFESTCVQCFEGVLEKGIVNPLWYKEDDFRYFYSRNGIGSRKEDYTEKGDYEIIFDPTTGKITSHQL